MLYITEKIKPRAILNRMNGNSSKALVEAMLMLLNQLKLHHWTADKYGQHLATDSLYGKFSDNVDKIVEVSLALFPHKAAGAVNLGLSMMVGSKGTKPFLEMMHKQLTAIHSSTDVPEFKNILEEMLSDTAQAIYLCRMD